MTPVNPFIVSGRILPEYFCDRVKESQALTDAVVNGNNLVLISPRRMGKTGLIRFCFDKPQIADNYVTFFIDILQTTTLSEFTYLLGREIFNTLAPHRKRLLHKFISALKSLSGKFGFDAATGTPTFNIQLGDLVHPEYTLDEIFTYLSESETPCIVAIDEFQQIGRYREKNIEALLRTHIQKIANTTFIFAGSERHLMQQMFLDSARPFYNSASIMELGPIPRDLYVEFASRLFAERGKRIPDSLTDRIYTLFEGHTFYMQKMLNYSFGNTADGQTCDGSIATGALEDMLNSYGILYRQTLSELSQSQKELLIAIAREGTASGITSGEFIRRYSLHSASSVQAAAKKLTDKEIVTASGRNYTVTDRLLAIWLNTVYGNLEPVQKKIFASGGEA